MKFQMKMIADQNLQVLSVRAHLGDQGLLLLDFYYIWKYLINIQQIIEGGTMDARSVSHSCREADELW